MIRTDSVPRPLRTTAALVGVAGMFALAGCSTPATDAAEPSTDSSPSAAPSSSASTDGGSSAATGAYADGTYSAEGSYATPESVESIQVTITLADDIITDVEVTGDPQKAESERYQAEFIGGISDEVEGQNIDDINVSRVAGSSLTSGGFNDAVDAIKSEAAA